MGVCRLTVKELLNHVDNEITAAYDRHSYDSEKRLALEAWGRRVEGIVSGWSLSSARPRSRVPEGTIR
jgi:hypothetical protein